MKGFTTEKILKALKSKKTGAAAGPSGLGFDTLKLLSKGSKSSRNLEGITVLITATVRGWLSPMSRRMIHSLRGVALPKASQSDDWRPIGISEVVCGLTERLITECIKTKCKSMSGSFQRGLSRNGIEALAMESQIVFDAGEAKGKNCLTLRMDVENAFNTLHRSPILKMVAEEFPQFLNYFGQSYGEDIEVVFSEEITVLSRMGVVQGRESSALIFDAVLGTQLKTNGIDEDCVRLVHDDIFLSATAEDLGKLREQIDIVMKSITQIGLKVQVLKNECLYSGDLNETEMDEIRVRLGLDQLKFRKGMPIGGIPVGTEEFCKNFLEGKVGEVIKQMNVVSTKMVEEPGIAISMIRKCILPKLIYLSRGKPLELWTDKALQLSRITRETLEGILMIDTTSDRYQTDRVDERWSHLMATKVANGGLGLWLPGRFGDAALLAAWIDNASITRDIEEGGEGSLVQSVREAAVRVQKLLTVEGDDQMRKDCSIPPSLQRIIEDLANGNWLGAAFGDGKTQSVLSNAVDSAWCRIYTETHFNGATIRKNRTHTTVVGGTLDDRVNLKQWIASQGPLAGAFMDILHHKSNRMTNKEIRAAVRVRLGIISGINHGCCSKCGLYDNFEIHADMCNLAGNMSAKCHADLVHALTAKQTGLLQWLPKTEVIGGAIPISRFFDIRKQASLSADKLEKTNGLLSDIAITPRGEPVTLIDICVTSVLTKENDAVCGITGACAAYYEKNNKDSKHALFMDDGKHLTSMGFDNRGGFSDNAVRVLRSFFSKDSKVDWKEDLDRRWVQKRTVAVISAIIHKWAGIRRDRIIDSLRRNPVPLVG